MKAGPFADVLVIDLTRVLAGPYCTMMLAELGARVIKVENPACGDDSRQFAPFIDGQSGYFASLNRGKESIALDLKDEADRVVFLKLVGRADVLVENFRPGIMERFGLGYETLRALNPRLIYCAVSGFGQNGPERGTAAFDGKLQAMSGIMSITGHEDNGPTRAGFALCDTIGAMTAAFAVSSALYQRMHTGTGQFVDVAMLDAALSFLSGQVAEYTVTGHIHRQFGNMSMRA